MNSKSKYLILALAALIPLTAGIGCKHVSGETPPTAVEQQIFDTETNYVSKVVVDAATGEVITNQVPVYTSTPKESVAADAAAVGSVVNAFAPGAGGLISGGLLAFLGLWGKLRSYKKKAGDSDKTAGVLAQNIEAIRVFIRQAIPNGTKYDDAIVGFIMKEQDKAQAIASVSDILGRYVKSGKTKQDVLEIRNALNNLIQLDAEK